MRYVESREPDAYRPARVRVMGGPGRAEDADIEYALRAVLWLVGAGDDPRGGGTESRVRQDGPVVGYGARQGRVRTDGGQAPSDSPGDLSLLRGPRANGDGASRPDVLVWELQQVRASGRATYGG